MEMILLVVSGFFYAAATVMLYALSTIRKQKLTTVAYIITAILAFVVSNLCVEKWQMKGAIVSTDGRMSLMSVNPMYEMFRVHNKIRFD